MKWFAMFVAAMLAFVPMVIADDWPNWRGPNYDGVSQETGWRTDWSDGGPKPSWEKNVGTGSSSVVVAGDRVYTLGNRRDRDIVWCFDAQTGDVIWQSDYECKLDKRMFEGGPAATPTLDGDRLYTLAHDGQLYCWNADDGTMIWKRDLRDDFRGRRPRWGFACSPLVVDEKLIIDNGGRGSSTIALDKMTGDPIWLSGDDKTGYSSAVPATFGGRRAVVLMKAKAVVGLTLDDGTEMFSYPWRTSYNVNAATPIVLDDLVFISSAYNHGCALLRVTDSGASLVYESPNMANQMDTSVIHAGHVYGFSGNAGSGELVSINLDNGEINWTQQGLGTGTLMLADGHLIVMSERGELLVAPVSPEGFHPTGRTQVFGGRCWVVPVLANGRIFAKNNDGDLAVLEVSEQ